MPKQKSILDLKSNYQTLCENNYKENLIINESELYDQVYNSNKIENSSITLLETKSIIDQGYLDREVDIREILEVLNLAKVIRSIDDSFDFDIDMLLYMHGVLMSGINDSIASRFRRNKEYVRVGDHLAPPPEFIYNSMISAVKEYKDNSEIFILERLAKFHLEFEFIHPFVDGNGRIGRALVNALLVREGLPPIMILSSKKYDYYKCFEDYDIYGNTQLMEELMYSYLSESLNMRIELLSRIECINNSDLTNEELIGGL